MLKKSANNFAARWDGYAVFAPALQRDCAEFTLKPKRQVRAGKTPGGFLNAGKAEMAEVPKKFTVNDRSWKFSTTRFPNSEAIAQSRNIVPFPYPSSPLAKYVTVNDMNYQAGIQYRNKFDTLSYQLLINHNLYVRVQRLVEANDLIFHPTMQAHHLVPPRVLDAVDVVERVLVEEKWNTLLSANADLLDSMGR
jgi:hypothetical protein